ncbi:ankyrin repeat and LEM domain-containing protein 1 [Podargus strigoides]
MSGAGRRGPVVTPVRLLRHGGDPNARPASEVPPLRVTASRGGCRCHQLLLKKQGDPELRGQDGNQATNLALGTIPWGAQRWLPVEDPGGPRRSLSFLTKDGTEGDVPSGLPKGGSGDAPLSSTRRSLLEELELGGGCGLGEPPLWPGCPLSLAVPSLTPWPHRDPGGSALPLQPLASSTLLSAGDELGGGPQGWMRAPPWAVPEASPGDNSSHPPQGDFGPGGSRSSPQPQSCGRVLGGHRAPPRVGVLEVGARDDCSLGDSSGDSECFVSALETLEPSEARGCLGAPRCCSPRSPPNAELVQGEGLGASPCCGGGSDVGDVGELLAQLQGCSLQSSPPCTPAPPGSPASLSAGDVTPQGQEPPEYRHVTPRTKSRLQRSAAQLSASSSSSLFQQTLEMPRRPPRLRGPRAVPRDPATTSGHCVTPQGEDMSSGDREGTGSLEDTQILPRAPSLPPGDSGSSGSGPTVLLLPGDLGHPQDTPSDAQGSPGSSPMVPGDIGHPQDTPSDAQGSPGSSPMVPGDLGHPQDTPPDALGSPSSSPRVLEGGSGGQDPSPLGTHQPSHGSFHHLLVPRLPGSATVGLGTPAVPLSPTRCSAQEHLEDEDEGRAPTERHRLGTEATTGTGDTVVQGGRACVAPPRPLSDEGLRRRLRALGDNPGPVTELTRWLYLRRLEELARAPRAHPDGPCGAGTATPGHSPELVAALRSGCVPDCAQDELALTRQFERPDRGRRWRGGLAKSSFTYLLLDPRTTQNLPLRAHRLSPAERFRTFVEAVFYVGKGTRARPHAHLSQALGQHRAGTQRGSPKVRRILEIWASGQGVISVHCFQNSVPEEAYTREGCVLETLGLQTVTNQRRGHCYGVAASWPAERRRRLGVHMLHRAMSIFLAEGERQIRPGDIRGPFLFCIAQFGEEGGLSLGEGTLQVGATMSQPGVPQHGATPVGGEEGRGPRDELLPAAIRRSRIALRPHGSVRELPAWTQQRGEGVLLVPQCTRDGCEPGGDTVWEQLEAGRDEGTGCCGRRWVVVMAPSISRMQQQEGSGGLCRSQRCDT